MLKWAVTFFLLAVIAAIFGFAGYATGTGMDIARVMFFIFLMLFLITLVMGLSTSPRPRVNEQKWLH